MLKQVAHSLQGSLAGACSQFKALAKILAVLVFPVPRGPKTSKHELFYSLESILQRSFDMRLT